MTVRVKQCQPNGIAKNNNKGEINQEHQGFEDAPKFPKVSPASADCWMRSHNVSEQHCQRLWPIEPGNQRPLLWAL